MKSNLWFARSMIALCAVASCSHPAQVDVASIVREISNRGGTPAAINRETIGDANFLCIEQTTDVNGEKRCRMTHEIRFSSNDRGTDYVTAATGLFKTMRVRFDFHMVHDMLCFSPQATKIAADGLAPDAVENLEAELRQRMFPEEQANCYVHVKKDGVSYLWSFLESGIPVNTDIGKREMVTAMGSQPDQYLP
jgi:hypothetical protein